MFGMWRVMESRIDFSSRKPSNRTVAELRMRAVSDVVVVRLERDGACCDEVTFLSFSGSDDAINPFTMLLVEDNTVSDAVEPLSFLKTNS